MGICRKYLNVEILLGTKVYLLSDILKNYMTYDVFEF